MNLSAAVPRPFLCCKRSDSITSSAMRSVFRQSFREHYMSLKFSSSFCVSPPSQVVSERTKPRLRHILSEVFLIIGGCTKDERFVATVTCLDPLRRSRLEVARLPFTEMEYESQNKKWVEFACVTFRNEVFISGERSFLSILIIYELDSELYTYAFVNVLYV